ncbi:hypothetical protein NQT74_17715 [Alteromonas stellipolaris]|uniref:hypothetical protein n=1 Tax=Alteromonas stellipolaris TaxID=233316 RepID=UPI00211809AD|nr:hypothetical protein [Alteromonas stellipolaris]MCQ8850421.1 hypothetical protein [Alteromonas stellipolaris]
MKKIALLLSITFTLLLAIFLLKDGKSNSKELTDRAKIELSTPSNQQAGLPLNHLEQNKKTLVNQASGEAGQQLQVEATNKANLDMQESFVSDAMSPEGESYQEQLGIDAMKVEMSLSMAPEGLSKHQDANAELPIPSQSKLDSADMD